MEKNNKLFVGYSWSGTKVAHLASVPLFLPIEEASEALVQSPHLFLTTKYHADPKGYTAFDLNDPFIYYINILCIVYIANLVLKLVRNALINFKVVSQLLKVKIKKRPENIKEATTVIIDIYKQLRGLDDHQSEEKLRKFVEKFLAFKK